MRPKLLLSGPIGCGKSTMIRNALGDQAARAGGYITLRVMRRDQLIGFDLAPAAALVRPEAMAGAGRFLDFTDGCPKQDPQVFEVLGSQLLREALKSPFAVADEFGGIELLCPPFREALEALLASPVPCIGVLKTREASNTLVQHLGLEQDYRAAYDAFCRRLCQDPDTEILSTTGRYDHSARQAVESWVQQYVRK